MKYELTEEEIENNYDGPEIVGIEYLCNDCECEFSTAYSIKTKCEKCGSSNITKYEILG